MARPCRGRSVMPGGWYVVRPGRLAAWHVVRPGRLAAWHVVRLWGVGCGAAMRATWGVMWCVLCGVGVRSFIGVVGCLGGCAGGRLVGWSVYGLAVWVPPEGARSHAGALSPGLTVCRNVVMPPLMRSFIGLSRCRGETYTQFFRSNQGEPPLRFFVLTGQARVPATGCFCVPGIARGRWGRIKRSFYFSTIIFLMSFSFRHFYPALPAPTVYLYFLFIM
jgi:hypothetical protein